LATAPQQLEEFISRYSPSIAAQARAGLRKLRARFPHATQLVYDNYNALAIGFGPSERASEVILSLALYPKWVTLFFLQGVRLADPAGILTGSGNQVRQLRLASAADLDRPELVELMQRAMREAKVPLEPRGDGSKGALLIKSISAKQRPRRPAD
jgi:hypothetical protein